MIIFKRNEEGLFVARLGNSEIQAKDKKEFNVVRIGLDIATPCDDDGCPDKLNPDDIDACVKTCKYKEELETMDSFDTMFGTGVALADAISKFRANVWSGKDNFGRPYDWNEDEKALAATDWQVDGVVYPANRSHAG